MSVVAAGRFPLSFSCDFNRSCARLGIPCPSVGNNGLTAALGVGDALALGPQRYAYTQLSDVQAIKSFHTPVFSFLSRLFSLSSSLPVYNFPQDFAFFNSSQSFMIFISA